MWCRFIIMVNDVWIKITQPKILRLLSHPSEISLEACLSSTSPNKKTTTTKFKNNRHTICVSPEAIFKESFRFLVSLILLITSYQGEGEPNRTEI